MFAKGGCADYESQSQLLRRLLLLSLSQVFKEFNKLKTVAIYGYVFLHSFFLVLQTSPDTQGHSGTVPALHLLFHFHQFADFFAGGHKSG